jgi:hypothetical protein
LRDSIPLPGTFLELTEKTGIPLEHLDHPQEFGHWLDSLSREFKVELDAEDKIIAFLKEKNLLLSGEEITSNDLKKLTARSTEIFAILQECRAEIDDLIKNGRLYRKATGPFNANFYARFFKELITDEEFCLKKDALF